MTATGHLQSAIALLRRFARGEGGNALAELGFFIPIIALGIFGAIEFGRYGIAQNQMNNAARAGVQYGATDLVTINDTAGMVSRARADTDFDPDVTATARNFCLCPGDETTEVDCNDACADDRYARRYAEVTVRRTMSPLFPIPTDALNYPVVARAKLRVR